MPPSVHLIYIPAVLILGVVLGFIWGARVTRETLQLEQRRAGELARKRAERAAQTAGDAGKPK